jgi:hypothetical protein
VVDLVEHDEVRPTDAIELPVWFAERVTGSESPLREPTSVVRNQLVDKAANHHRQCSPVTVDRVGVKLVGRLSRSHFFVEFHQHVLRDGRLSESGFAIHEDVLWIPTEQHILKRMTVRINLFVASEDRFRLIAFP